MLPDPQEDLLRNLFGIGLIAKHASGKRHHTPQMARHQFTAGLFIALGDGRDQFVVRNFVQTISFPFTTPGTIALRRYHEKVRAYARTLRLSHGVPLCELTPICRFRHVTADPMRQPRLLKP